MHHFFYLVPSIGSFWQLQKTRWSILARLHLNVLTLFSLQCCCLSALSFVIRTPTTRSSRRSPEFSRQTGWVTGPWRSAVAPSGGSLTSPQLLSLVVNALLTVSPRPVHGWISNRWLMPTAEVEEGETAICSLLIQSILSSTLHFQLSRWFALP